MKRLFFCVLSCLAAMRLAAADMVASLDLTASAQGTDMYHFMKNDPNDEPYTEFVSKGGRRCIHIPATKYGYFRVDDNTVPSTMHNLIFKITYFDEGTGEVKLQYNGTTGDYLDATVNKTNTMTWMTTTMAVRDASLRNAQNQQSDFRLNDNNYISRIEIYNGVLDPLQEPVYPHLGGSSYSEFIGKSVAGYQAWFDTGGRTDFWVHWSNNAIESDGTRWPRRYNHTFEIYPDVTLYEDADLAQTGFADFGNGEPARLFTSRSAGVINKHFELMQQAGMDGVAVQRFLGASLRSITSSESATPLLIRRAAEQTGRIFYICYDITSNGLENSWADIIRFDWVYNIEQNYRLTESPAYATVNGKPVVQVWGTGFTDNHPGTANETIALIEFLRSRGCYVIGGVPTYWRENRNDAKGPSQPDPANQESFEQVYLHYDMVSPWMVGRFSNDQEYQYFRQLLTQDVTYCQSKNIDYMPVVFAGFGWATWNPGQLNQAPRRAGEFLWRQANTARQAGLKNLYFAMLDEYDEGTALLPAATDWTMLPTDAYFLTASADGIWLSSDFYVRLAGEATRLLKGQSQPTDSVPVPYSLGPVFYRNSFEQRTTRYNYVNGVAQSEGTFPIDPCFYRNSQVRTNGVSNAGCSIEQGDAHSGLYSARLSLTASAAADYVYQIAELKIPLACPLKVSCFRKADGISAAASIELTTRGGQVFRAQSAPASADWQELSLVIPSSCIGDTLSGLRLVYSGTTAGAVEARFDDFLIEQTDEETNALIGLSDDPVPGYTCYDLLGRPVAHPAAGIYIRVVGTDIKKIIYKD